MIQKFHDCFLTHLKAAQFVVPLIIHGKRKVLAGLQIHPKKILTRKNNAHKARKTRKRVNHIRREDM